MERPSLRAAFESGGFDVVGEAASGSELVALAARLKPRLVVVDVSAAGFSNLRLIRELTTSCPSVSVIGLSDDTDSRGVLALFAAGAAGYLPAGAGTEELLHAVRVVASGMKYVSPAVTGVVLEDLMAHGECSSRSSGLVSPTPDPLSAREREVLRLLAEGKSSKEIALQLHIGVATVETHRRHIMDKLNLRTIAELTKYALRVGLTTLD